MTSGTNKNNDTDILSMVETDTIGEILNISMGAAATAVSVLLNKKVSITTPVVKIIKNSEFEFKELEPAVGVEINYIKGLSGSNLMIMSLADVKAIVCSLLGTSEITEGDEIDEMQMSALGEVMNQMMGSASTAMATFFNKSVSISPPRIFEPKEINNHSIAKENDTVVTVSFKFVVDDIIDSHFITVLPIDFTKELVLNAMSFNGSEPSSNKESETEYENVVGHKQIPKPIFDQDKPADNPEKNNKPKNNKKSPNNKKLTKEKNSSPIYNREESMENNENLQKNISVKKVDFSSFDENGSESEAAEQVNLDLVMGVELCVTVELGRTKRLVKDVLNITKGSIIELDKQAGEPVDIIVNGQLIAKGDVVVIDDNFGVRITKVITNKNP